MIWTVLLLIASNTFMTIAWYGHLKFRDKPLAAAIVVSWLIALPEYMLQVPANRLGYRWMSATQLKVLQEVISLSVFVVFAWLYFGESPSWRTLTAFVLITVAVGLVRGGQQPSTEVVTVEPSSVARSPEAASATVSRASSEGASEVSSPPRAIAS